MPVFPGVNDVGDINRSPNGASVESYGALVQSLTAGLGTTGQWIVNVNLSGSRLPLDDPALPIRVPTTPVGLAQLIGSLPGGLRVAWADYCDWPMLQWPGSIANGVVGHPQFDGDASGFEQFLQAIAPDVTLHASDGSTLYACGISSVGPFPGIFYGGPDFSQVVPGYPYPTGWTVTEDLTGTRYRGIWFVDPANTWRGQDPCGVLENEPAWTYSMLAVRYQNGLYFWAQSQVDPYAYASFVLQTIGAVAASSPTPPTGTTPPPSTTGGGGGAPSSSGTGGGPVPPPVQNPAQFPPSTLSTGQKAVLALSLLAVIGGGAYVLLHKEE